MNLDVLRLFEVSKPGPVAAPGVAGGQPGFAALLAGVTPAAVAAPVQAAPAPPPRWLLRLPPPPGAVVPVVIAPPLLKAVEAATVPPARTTVLPRVPVPAILVPPVLAIVSDESGSPDALDSVPILAVPDDDEPAPVPPTGAAVALPPLPVATGPLPQPRDPVADNAFVPQPLVASPGTHDARPVAGADGRESPRREQRVATLSAVSLRLPVAAATPIGDHDTPEIVAAVPPPVVADATRPAAAAKTETLVIAPPVAPAIRPADDRRDAPPVVVSGLVRRLALPEPFEQVARVAEAVALPPAAVQQARAAPVTVAPDTPPRQAVVPETPLSVASERLGDVQIGVSGGAQDLRLSLAAQPAAMGLLAADMPRLVAELQGQGVRLHSIDLSGGGSGGNGQAPPQARPSPTVLPGFLAVDETVDAPRDRFA